MLTKSVMQQKASDSCVRSPRCSKPGGATTRKESFYFTSVNCGCGCIATEGGAACSRISADTEQLTIVSVSGTWGAIQKPTQVALMIIEMQIFREFDSCFLFTPC